MSHVLEALRQIKNIAKERKEWRNSPSFEETIEEKKLEQLLKKHSFARARMRFGVALITAILFICLAITAYHHFNPAEPSQAVIVQGTPQTDDSEISESETGSAAVEVSEPSEQTEEDAAESAVNEPKTVETQAGVTVSHDGFKNLEEFKTSAIHCKAIFIDRQASYAIINENVMAVGDFYRNAELVQVFPDHVIMKFGKAKRIIFLSAQ